MEASNTGAARPAMSTKESPSIVTYTNAELDSMSDASRLCASNRREFNGSVLYWTSSTSVAPVRTARPTGLDSARYPGSATRQHFFPAKQQRVESYAPRPATSQGYRPQVAAHVDRYAALASTPRAAPIKLAMDPPRVDAVTTPDLESCRSFSRESNRSESDASVESWPRTPVSDALSTSHEPTCLEDDGSVHIHLPPSTQLKVPQASTSATQRPLPPPRLASAELFTPPPPHIKARRTQREMQYDLQRSGERPRLYSSSQSRSSNESNFSQFSIPREQSVSSFTSNSTTVSTSFPSTKLSTQHERHPPVTTALPEQSIVQPTAPAAAGKRRDSDAASIAASVMSARWGMSPKERLGLGGRIRTSDERPWEAFAEEPERNHSSVASSSASILSWRAPSRVKALQWLPGSRRLFN